MLALQNQLDSFIFCVTARFSWLLCKINMAETVGLSQIHGEPLGVCRV